MHNHKNKNQVQYNTVPDLRPHYRWKPHQSDTTISRSIVILSFLFFSEFTFTNTYISSGVQNAFLTENQLETWDNYVACLTFFERKNFWRNLKRKKKTPVKHKKGEIKPQKFPL